VKVFAFNTESSKAEYELYLAHVAEKYTKSEAVARIADRTASQHLSWSRDVIPVT